MELIFLKRSESRQDFRRFADVPKLLTSFATQRLKLDNLLPPALPKMGILVGLSRKR